jgi:hypothetical protein
MKELATLHSLQSSHHLPLFCSGSTTVVSSSFPPVESGRCSSVEDLVPAQSIQHFSLETWLMNWAQLLLLPLRESLLPCTSPCSGISIGLERSGHRLFKFEGMGDSG